MLQLYLKMLSNERDRWEVATATDARGALQTLQQFPFDVVVSDLVMPGGMNGAEFLNEVKARYPHSSRIILSGLSDRERAIRLLGTSHQFLTKPFNAKELKATLERIGGLDAYLKDEKLQNLVSRLGTLPSFPVLYIKIMQVLESPDSSIETIAEIVAQDPGMTAKILQIVNSAAMGLTRKVGSPFEALQFIGLDTVRSLVLSAHIFSCFERTHLKGFSINRLWDHAIRSGNLARMIMKLEKAEPAEAEDAYTAGMLHDIGKLMLAHNLPEKFQDALQRAAERNVPFYEVEADVFGATHAGVAAYLLGLWGLPVPIVEAVAFHHHPERSDLHAFGPLAAVHVANVLEHELSRTDPEQRLVQVNHDYLAGIRLEHRIADWRAEANRLLSAQPADGRVD